MAGKKGRKKNAQAQAAARPPVGQVAGVVKRPEKGKKKAEGRGKGGGRGRGGRGAGADGFTVVGRRKGGKDLLGPTVESVVEEGLVRHHMVEKAHAGAIMSVVIFDNTVYTASHDKTLKQWTPTLLPTGRWELTEGVKVPLGEVAWCLLSVGDWLFCGLGNGTIRGYSKDLSQQELTGHKKRVSCLLHHQNCLISGSYDGTIKIWLYNAESKVFACSHTLEEQIPTNVTCMHVLGDKLWIGGTSGVSILDLVSLKVAAQLQPKKSVAGLIEYESHIIAAFSEGSIVVYDGAGTEKTSLTLPAGPLLAIAGFPHPLVPQVLVGHSRGQLSAIKLPEFTLKRSWQAFKAGKAHSIACCPTGGLFVVGAENGSLQLWQKDPNRTT